ncbi:MAG: respiratory nitrate reductase subunit gamma [Thaumarchaeota archaeon]|nr:respiratory nitrate reductase subunit gamma [Candidatus Geocrenenecus arthurdayi]
MDPLIFIIGYITPYIAFFTLILGLMYRVVRWLSIPVPFRLPVAPAPITYTGVLKRMSLDFFAFRSLLKGNKKLWIGGYVFHLALAITLISHIINVYFHELWAVIGYGWYEAVLYSGIFFLAALSFLLVRRIVLPNVRYISKLSDYIILILLITIVFLGVYMRSFGLVDVSSVSEYMHSLLMFNPIPPPGNIWFLTHYVLAQILFIYIPFSKVSHLIGWILATTRNMRNITRWMRHVNPWDYPVEVITWDEYYQKFKDELEAIGPGGERR